MGSSGPGRVRVERGIYRQPNGKYAVCWRHAGRLRFRTISFDLAETRRERLALIAATREGKVPVSPRLCFEIVAGWWLERFEAKVAAGERHPRTLEAHRYQLDRHLLPALAPRRIASITVDDVAELLDALRRKGCSPKTSASALATLPGAELVEEDLGGRHRPEQVGLDHAPVLFALVRGERRRQHDAGVVDEDVRAAELLQYPLGGAGDRCAVRDVGLDGDRAVAELVGKGLDAVRAAGEQRDPVAVCGQRAGGRLADAG
jgi:hypothetical protein